MSEFEAEKATTGKTPCDCGCGDCGGAAKPTAADAQPDNSRRKLLFGGVIATPAIVMLSSRSALATGSYGGQCTASAHASVNLSKPQATHCKSKSPGCWKNTLAWPSPFKPGLPDPRTGAWSGHTNVTAYQVKQWILNNSDCLKNYKGDKSAKAQTMGAYYENINNQVTMVRSYFPWGEAKSFMEALHTGGGGNLSIQRHAIAGILNAAQFGPSAFGYTVSEFVAMVNSRFNKDPQLEADLEYLGNDRGSASCPGAGSGQSINWCSILNFA